MRSSVDVHRCLLEQGIEHEIVPVERSVLSVGSATQTLGLSPSEVAKNLVLQCGTELLLAIVSGDRKVDWRKLQDIFGERVRLAGAGDVLQITEYPLGATPPVAHSEKLRTLVDEGILRHTVVYSSAGEPSAVLKIRAEDLIRATGGEVLPICRPEVLAGGSPDHW